VLHVEHARLHELFAATSQNNLEKMQNIMKTFSLQPRDGTIIRNSKMIFHLPNVTEKSFNYCCHVNLLIYASNELFK
jgi:hypothetical protein